MTTSQPNVTAQVESHIAAYLRNFYDPDSNDPGMDQAALDVACRREATPLHGLSVIESQFAGEFTLPNIVAKAEDATPISVSSEASWWRVPVEVKIQTSISEDVSEETGALTKSLSAANHAARVGQAFDLLTIYMEGRAAIPDTFPKANVFGWEQTGFAEAQEETSFVTRLTFTASASPYFPL